ncbi:hypothetical protein [Helicobacter bizzozeronii]|uniref:hypothetical protein n=2 Tax=Helicobacter bizzozeronii TaxID=56877 RepID=UPI0018F7E8AD|nr:hypothetical protein [Helicobacter bizzozeronii]
MFRIIKRRIPKHRCFMRQILFSAGIAENDPLSYVRASLALSLTDTFWVTPTQGQYAWEDFNLYNNPFNKPLEAVALMGFSTKLRENEKRPSLELTTNGMLRKCWHRGEDGMIRLIKGQIGTESYSEYYSAQIAQAMGLHAITYNLAQHKSGLVCQCGIFTSEDLGFLPMADCLDYPCYKALENNPQARIDMLAQVV